jgi:hypothetical protein
MTKEKRKKTIGTFFTFSLFFFVVLSPGGLLSCGLEGVAFIAYIPPQNVDYRDTDTSILLPALSSSDDVEGAEFDNFIIFYRLYISDKIISTGRQLEGYGTNDGRTAINSTLNSDYNGLYSLTDITSTSVNTSNLESTFSNRRYCLLTLADAGMNSVNINNVLGSGSLGKRVYIAFPPNPGIESRPTLTVYDPFVYDDPYDPAYDQPIYFLQRAVENQNLNPPLNFRPQPNRDFLNHGELYNTANVTNELNADVATNSAADVQYTYVSMYIAARGTSLVDMPPRTIYSQPTFIGIFRLAAAGSGG